MLHHYFKPAYVLARIRSNVLGEIFDAFIEYLESRGHPRSAIRNFIGAAEHFGYWLKMEQISVASINEETVNKFLDSHLPACSCPPPAPRRWKTVRTALRHLLRVLNKINNVPPKPFSKSGYINTAIVAFRAHLSKTCGLSDSTIESYTHYVRDFLEVKYRSGPLDFSSIKAADLMTAISNRARRNSPAAAQHAASALRSYIRFLQLKGQCDGKLVHAVPRIPHRKNSNIPSALTDEEVQRLLSTFDLSTSLGQRDYAMVLCMVELGLRDSEVTRLCLDDINWRNATLRVPAGKTRSKVLPLSKRLGKAIAVYIRKSRPKISERKLFFRHKQLEGVPIGGQVIRYVVRKAFILSGLFPKFTGTHVLRHTAATRLHQKGASIKEVADILGHQRLDTTAIYTKVNLPMLSTVPLPWPEVQS